MAINKKYRLIALLTLVPFGLWLWFYLHNQNFVIENFKKYTGVKEFIVKYKYYDNHQTFIEVLVSQTDKERLLKNFEFQDNLNKLKGRIQPPFIANSPRFIYFVIEDGYGPYGYILFALEKESNTLQLYEEYGD